MDCSLAARMPTCCRFENFWSSDLRKDPRRLFLGQQSAPEVPQRSSLKDI
jgi:hypothetical protein